MTNKILIADDEENNLKTVARIIKFYHPEVEVEMHTESEKALEILSKNIKDYSFALLDLRFKRQEMQGLELIANTRKISDTFPIIAYSGDNYDKEKILEAGANEVIQKPFEMEHFNEIISKYLKTK